MNIEPERLSDDVALYQGDCLASLRSMDSQSVQCCVTSPPYYGLRDYGHAGQIGLESTPDLYVARMVEVFREVRRVLRDDGTLFLNIGDSYNAQPGQRKVTDKPGAKQNTVRGSTATPSRSVAGLKAKDLIGIPWMLAFALRSDGWYLRQDIIWHKPNPMPESVRDRCTKAHEYVFLLAKSAKYFYDADAVKEPSSQPERAGKTEKTFHSASRSGSGRNDVGREVLRTDARNRRSVWTVTPKPYKGAHFAVMPPELVRPCVRAGSRPAGRRCDCEDLIHTPTGSGSIEDPTRLTGRAGMNRPRRDDEGRRLITRREQRHEASQLKSSLHRAEMESICGSAFAHYIRTDRNGARPLPEDFRTAFTANGWITPAPRCGCADYPGDTVLDPFGGSGTVACVAVEEGRKSILCELNSTYCGLIRDRMKATINVARPRLFDKLEAETCVA